MTASVYKRAALAFFLPTVLVAVSVVFLLQVFFERASGEVVESWRNNELITLQQGNILSAITKLQRSIQESGLLDSAIAIDEKGKVLAKVGIGEFDDPGRVEGEGFQRRRLGLFKMTFWLKSDFVRVGIVTSAPLLLVVSIVLVLYFATIFVASGFYLRKVTAAQEALKSRIELSEMQSRVAVAEAIAVLSKQVAHDIRAPVSALRAVVGSSGLPDEQKNLIEMASQRINSIAESLLSQSRSLASVFDVASVIEGVISEKRVLNASLSVDIENSAQDALVLGDWHSFARLVSNLVDNSIEATPVSESPKINITVSRMGDRIRISLKDSGIGISAPDLAVLGTQEFASRKPNGNGLGVLNAQAEISRMGGAFSIQSKEGEGTTVLIDIPQAISKR